jgi:hypothetical protein
MARQSYFFSYSSTQQTEGRRMGQAETTLQLNKTGKFDANYRALAPERRVYDWEQTIRDWFSVAQPARSLSDINRQLNAEIDAACKLSVSLENRLDFLRDFLESTASINTDSEVIQKLIAIDPTSDDYQKVQQLGKLRERYQAEFKALLELIPEGPQDVF